MRPQAKTAVVTIAFTLTLAAATAIPSHSSAEQPTTTPISTPTPQRATWQYRRLGAMELQALDPKKKGSQERALNLLGAEGWDLVAVTAGVPQPRSVTAADLNGSGPVYYVEDPVFFFKRLAQ